MLLSLNIASVIWALTVLAGILLIRDVVLRYLGRDQATSNADIEASILAHVGEHQKAVAKETADNMRHFNAQLAITNKNLDAVSRSATSAAIAAGLTPDKL